MDSSKVVLDLEDGNTVSSSKSSKGKKQLSAAKHWCFTFNNYDKKDIDILIITFNRIKANYLFGEEIGEEGTEHLQGYFCLENKLRLSALKKLFDVRIHFEVCRNIDASIEYCGKDGKVHSNMIKSKEIKIPDFRPWQLELLELLGKDPDDRSIIWIYDNGNSGKSFITRWLVMRYGAVFCSGKKADVYHNISKIVNSGGYFSIVVFDVPRTNIEYVNFEVIESIKNGLLFSGKYDSGTIMFDSPHIVVFANSPPIETYLTSDRWVIYRIEMGELVRIKEDNSDPFENLSL